MRTLGSKWLPRIACAGLLSLAVALGPGVGGAHEGASGVVKERMELMKGMGANMKALAAMMKGETAYDSAQVSTLAGRIAKHGGTAMTQLFPEGSLHKPTEALPQVWEKWDRFAELAAQLSDAAGALALAAGNDRTANDRTGGAATGAMVAGGGELTPARMAEASPDVAFGQLARTCSACHKDFRLKK